MIALRFTFAILLATVCGGAAEAEESSAPPRVRSGSKAFTESAVLAEIATQLARSVGADATHQKSMGGSPVLFNALRNGELDVYPEYTGTLRLELLASLQLPDDDALRAALAQEGIEIAATLGFNNTYAIGMRREQADRLGIRTISDLRAHPDLRFGFTNEFLDRGDGWPALRMAYALPQTDVRGMEHALAYRALIADQIDVMELYSTDAEIQHYSLAVLADDRGFFPRYDAVLLIRADLAERAPRAVEALRRLDGAIGEATMIALNARVQIKNESHEQAAADFLHGKLGIARDAREQTVAAQILARTGEHLTMVGISLLAAILVAVPLGVIAAKRASVAQSILGVVGVIQTIPSLALLVLLMAPLARLGVGGAGYAPAIVALFLYSLLPIVRNTYTGLHSIAPELRESAIALGLPPARRLLSIELPLASRTIVAGVKTAAVINIGFATLGAFIGAGGYGQPIFIGVSKQDNAMILQGAIPAAVLAIITQLLFEWIERIVVPRGLRLHRAA